MKGEPADIPIVLGIIIFFKKFVGILDLINFFSVFLFSKNLLTSSCCFNLGEVIKIKLIFFFFVQSKTFLICGPCPKKLFV